MASSSNRSTMLEGDLRGYYKLAFVRLISVQRIDEAKFITEKFAEVLDWSPWELPWYLELGYWDQKDGQEIFCEERRTWKDVSTKMAVMRRHERIRHAADAVCCAAFTLSQAGRFDEAAKFSLWAEEIQHLTNFIDNPDGIW